MPPKQITAVRPIPGYFIPGIPAVEMQVSKGQAQRLVKTGAFELGGSTKVDEEKQAAGEQAIASLDAATPVPADAGTADDTEEAEDETAEAEEDESEEAEDEGEAEAEGTEG